MKYNKVFYYDKNGLRKEFLAKNLDSKENVAALKKYEIWDDTELIQLTPVDFVEHETKSSFFRAVPNQPNRLVGSDESFLHDQKVNELYEALSAFQRLKVWFKDFSYYPSKDSVLCDLQTYTWNFEVTRELYDFDQKVRFDIFGQCSKGTISKKRPEVIVEVVDSHFLDADVFNSLRERTKQLSSIVLFYFLANENLYNRVENDKLRVSSFMKDGHFYYGGILIREFEPKIQDEIQNRYLYYNQISQFYIKPIRTGKKLNIGEIKRENN
jgi:hypothetical protein